MDLQKQSHEGEDTQEEEGGRLREQIWCNKVIKKKIQGHETPAVLEKESKETNGTWMDADEMQRGMTSEKAAERRRDGGIKGWVMLDLFLSSIYSI